ncbi:MAG TPA: FAD-binding oxidoreductase [Chitinivibrionales bacterium]|nr:FAD-binding oxidoreductase [Chitinivibrionales bacterium]
MKSFIGRETIREAAPELLYDESRFTLGIPEKVYFPQNLNDLLSVVRGCNRDGTPITVIGGKTGIAGGCVPTDGCTAICISETNRILSVDKSDDGTRVLLCEPGITLENIAAFLDRPRAWPYPVPGTNLLEGKQWLYPPDPTETTAQLGGTVATNASGARSFHFGPTRAWVHSLSVVLANGGTLNLKRGDCKARNGVFAVTTGQGSVFSVNAPAYRIPAIKNASGYYAADDMDLIDLFIGSEGTLGIFSMVGIRLAPKPFFAAGLSFFPSRKAAFGFASFLRDQQQVLAIEYFDETAVAFLESVKKDLPFALPDFPPDKKYAVYWECRDDSGAQFEDQMDKWEESLSSHGSSFDDTWSGFKPKEIEKLKAIRHGIPEAVNSAIARYKRDHPDIRKISTDTALASGKFEETFDWSIDKVKASGLAHAAFGHLGDFHLHINLIPRNSQEMATAKELYGELMAAAISAGGTVSAEHGIGKLKTAYLREMYGKKAIAEMRAIKTAFDPQWLLNRGTLLDYPAQ